VVRAVSRRGKGKLFFLLIHQWFLAVIAKRAGFWTQKKNWRFERQADGSIAISRSDTHSCPMQITDRIVTRRAS